MNTYIILYNITKLHVHNLYTPVVIIYILMISLRDRRLANPAH